MFHKTCNSQEAGDFIFELMEVEMVRFTSVIGREELARPVSRRPDVIVVGGRTSALYRSAAGFIDIAL